MTTAASRTHKGLTALAAAGAALVVLLPVLIRPGWPHNHELLSFFTRMAAIRGQWRLWHLIPVWSTSEQWGYGSPAPALYHKTFLYTSSIFYLISDNPKLSICLALGCFMMVAFSGAALAVRIALGRSNLAAEWTAGTLLISCNYATTDWLVRGAFAEFAALAVASWVFAWCIALIVNGRWSLWIGPAMAALTLSHSVIGLFSFLPLGLASLIAIGVWRGQVARWIRPAIMSVTMFVALTAPFLFPIAVLLRWSRSDVLLQPGYTPRESHLPISRLFWDTAWYWGERWGGFTVQIDLALLLGLLILCAMQRSRVGVTTFLVMTVALMLLLQTRPADWLYDTLPGANYIQFSWRLLTFLSIALAIGNGLLTARFNLLAPFVGILLVASTLPNKPWWRGISYSWYSQADIADSMHGDVLEAGEYLPRTTAATIPKVEHRLPAPTGEVTKPVFPPNDICTIKPVSGPALEVSSATFVARCTSPGTAILPLFEVPGLSKELTRTCDDPRARIDLPAGETQVIVIFPSWSALLLASIRNEGFRFSYVCH